MPAYFPTIREQLRADIVGVMGVGCKIYFGRPRKPIKPGPFAVVATVVSRQGVGRHVQETYGASIALFFPLPDPDDTDIESFLMEKADALIMLLAPFDTADVPAPVGAYAGVGSLRRVTGVTPGEDKDTDELCSVVLDFSCMTTIYQ